MPAKATKLTDPYIEAGAAKQGLGTGVLHDLNVSHGASYAAFVFGGTKDEGCDLLERRGIANYDPDSAYVIVWMPCQTMVAVPTRDDFPSETLAAPCGHPEHFVCYYVAPS